ncbi:hypothetical protein [Enterobacter asburiae]|uniref:hypothetical protein n=1 Tax=Enterobacter asburiae TaxID=61645 RepID=UPI00069A6541|nr:hypothetical protein [Enterobacter asburiae]CZV10256.1 Uncharacterised protein [Enterobacter asburiae]SAD69164.1 Uncharacterised protein [Enterobacter asburiae]SAE22308.1 Uncharacterised protein [Enterobacter asburiae]SAF48146.1 Uncharacterised protein [Enterobacter asburiae]
MSIKNLVVMIKHNGLLSSMSQLEKLYQAAIENEQKLAELEAHLAALAAENAGLKSAIEKHADSYIMCGYCRTERDGKNDDVCEVLDSIPATDAFLAEVRAHDLNAFIRHHSAELDAHIKNGGEQFDEKSVRIRDIIVSARLFREQIRKEAAK